MSDQTVGVIREDSPLVSIIIPFYNTTLNLVERCLQQINLLPNEEIEVILVDDGSESKAVEQLRLLTQEFSVPITIFSKENGGQNSAREAGIDLAKGTYIFFHDSDDYIDSAAFIEVLEYLKSNSPDVMAFGYDQIDSEGRTLREVIPWCPGFNQVTRADILVESDSLCRQLYRTEAIRSLSFGLTQGIRIGEDLSSAVSYALALNNFQSFGKVIYHYVRYRDSATGSVTPDRLDDIRTAFDVILSRFGNIDASIYYELEWMAILHVLMWGNRRIIETVGPRKEYKHDVYAWMNARFPSWRRNPYISRALIDGGIRYRLLIMGKWKTFYCFQKLYKVLFAFQKR